MGWVKLSLRPADRRALRPATGATTHEPLCAVCLALICGMLVSCGGGEPKLAPPAEPSPEINASLTAVTQATPIGANFEPHMGEVVWATATDPATNAPIEQVSSYRPDAPQIVAAVHAASLPAGSVVTATWEYNDTSLDAFTTRLTPTDGNVERWLSFQIARDPDVPWPAGRYEVTVSVNGANVQQAAVQVGEQS